MKHLNIFKSSLLIFSIILLFAACKSKSTTEARDIQLLTDTSAYMNNTFSDTAVAKQGIISEKNQSSKHSETNSETHNDGNSSSSTTTSPTNNNGNTSTSTTTTTSNQNKGMSKAAKGAIIGGAAGAVGGAIISKKVGGAAIGAAVGAASGYIIGSDQDKQDGRVKKKKKKN